MCVCVRVYVCEWKATEGVRCRVSVVFRGVLPEPAAAGGGDVVVSTASVNGRLDFSLTALWGEQSRVLKDDTSFAAFAELEWHRSDFRHSLHIKTIDTLKLQQHLKAA